MISILATLFCACGIAWLFFLDRVPTGHNSKALWIPVLWIALTSSRPVSSWFGVSPTVAESQLDGSPIDAAIFGVLLIAACGVLIRRNRRTLAFLKANWQVSVYFFYCLISVAWALHPDVAFKRWVKAIGDLAMVLVIITDQQPLAALRQTISRLGFFLFPISMLIIKYYWRLGHAYDVFGVSSLTGVTTNKNMLGLTVYIILMGVFWHFHSLLMNKGAPNRGRRLVAQGILLASGIILLVLSRSSTSIACTILGSGLVFASSLRAIRRRPARLRMLCLAVVVVGGAAVLFSGSLVANALDRDATFSGRTVIWTNLLPASPHPIIGAGFESFWISPDALTFQRSMANQDWKMATTLNEAHNGYLEVYLNLGLIGVCLIVLLLISGYSRACKAFGRDRELGSLMLAYIVSGSFYCITEAGFRTLNPNWIFMLLAIVGATGVHAGIVGRKAPKRRASSGVAEVGIYSSPGRVHGIASGASIVSRTLGTLHVPFNDLH
jgi:exopolysaccharide production protein ExoQ